ncbi:MAG: preprotein translocase [Bdellovibrio sp.]|nr:MAG: preprotein translocase [Bdellovibrio sp.]
MFNLGISEIIAISIIALFVIGPERLPQAARTLARFINEIRRATSGLKNSMGDFENSTENFLSKLEALAEVNEDTSTSKKKEDSKENVKEVSEEEKPS